MYEDEVSEKMQASADDKLWSALAWIPVSPLYPIVSILMLLLEDKKDRPFVRYNAVVSLVAGVVLIPIAVVTMGIGALGYLVFFWWAYQASQGQMVEIPWVSDFARKQGWV